ncbi:MAG: hypothetical protein E3J72_13670 [Planctomycetota bacterium]|nr:MAG: hypothetical protein E3J72_13670 [Planctomycetota bacterium]
MDWQCDRTEDLVDNYLAGEADDADWDFAVKHAEECPECRQKLDDATSYESLMKSAMLAMAREVGTRPSKSPETFLSSGSSRRSARISMRRRNYTYIAIAAASVIIILVLFIAYGSLVKIKKSTPEELARLQVNTMSKAVALIRHPGKITNDRQLVALLEPKLAEKLKQDELPQVKEGKFLDPWEKPFRVMTDETSGRVIFYSVGPNGIDEGCKGDDVFPSN